MRAIIKCSATAIPDEELDISEHIAAEHIENILARHLAYEGWVPRLTRNDDLVTNSEQEILDTISEHHLPLVERTRFVTILHSPTHSWGIVSRPTSTQSI